MDDKPNAPPTPRQYVEQIVLPTLHEFLAAREDRRRACLACVVICHCADTIGLAEEVADVGSAGSRGRPRRRALDTATDAVQAEMRRQWGGMFDVVQGIADGTKHRDWLPLLPGTERHVTAFAWDAPEGWDQARWEGLGLALDVDVEALVLNTCAQQVHGAFLCAYPRHLGGVGLSFTGPGFMGLGQHVPGLAFEGTWLGKILAWAPSKPEVAEVWLSGRRATGTARPHDDANPGIVLVPSKRRP